MTCFKSKPISFILSYHWSDCDGNTHNSSSGCCILQIMQVTHQLHWLPICFWLKALVITFKALHGLAQRYFCLPCYEPVYPFRSARENLLLISILSEVWLMVVMIRTFSMVVPVMWNSWDLVGIFLNMFWCKLKTSLFQQMVSAAAGFKILVFYHCWIVLLMILVCLWDFLWGGGKKSETLTAGSWSLSKAARALLRGPLFCTG